MLEFNKEKPFKLKGSAYTVSSKSVVGVLYFALVESLRARILKGGQMLQAKYMVQ